VIRRSSRSSSRSFSSVWLETLNVVLVPYQRKSLPVSSAKRFDSYQEPPIHSVVATEGASISPDSPDVNSSRHRSINGGKYRGEKPFAIPAIRLFGREAVYSCQRLLKLVWAVRQIAPGQRRNSVDYLAKSAFRVLYFFQSYSERFL